MLTLCALPAHEIRSTREAVDDDDELFAFCCAAAGIDMEGYYMQFAVSEPSENVQAIAEERSEGQKGDDVYAFYESAVTQFGSLSSVYEDVAVSEALQYSIVLQLYFS